MSDIPLFSIKIILAGPEHVGKKSLIDRYGQDKVTEARVISPDVKMNLVRPGHEEHPVTLWAISGQNRFFGSQNDFFKGCHGVALVYDVGAPGSFFDLMFLHEEIQGIAPGAPMMVIGNKIDQRVIVPPEEARGWALSLDMGFAQTSAVTGEGVAEAFSTLVSLAAQEYQRLAHAPSVSSTDRH
jgi:GTPase SAR1 family protein